MAKTRRRFAGWIGFALILVLMFAAYKWLERHPEHNIFAPLKLAHPPGWATQRKLAAYVQEPQDCFTALDKGNVLYNRLPAIGSGTCRADQRTQVRSWPVAPATIRPDGVAPSCAVSVALLLWQRDVLQPMARLHLGRDVRSIEHLGSYSCRTIRGRTAMSQHASGNAIDLSAFVLSDGRRVTLVEHWDVRDGRSAFLRAVRDKSCSYFTTVLSPDYNAAHADHFHFDQASRPGGWTVCR